MGLVDQSKPASFADYSEAIVPDFESNEKTLKGFKQMGPRFWLCCENRLERSKKEGAGTSGGEGTIEYMTVAAGLLMGPMRREKQEGATGSYVSQEMWAAFSSLDLGLPIGREHFGLHSQATSGSDTPVWDCCICFLRNRSVFLLQERPEKSLWRTRERLLGSLASGGEGCNLHERGRQQYTDGSSVIAFLCLTAPGALHLGTAGFLPTHKWYRLQTQFQGDQG